MDKFEYDYQNIHVGPYGSQDELVRELNKRGEDGWELVGFYEHRRTYQDGNDLYECIFKRKLTKGIE